MTLQIWVIKTFNSKTVLKVIIILFDFKLQTAAEWLWYRKFTTYATTKKLETDI